MDILTLLIAVGSFLSLLNACGLLCRLISSISLILLLSNPFQSEVSSIIYSSIFFLVASRDELILIEI